jgi:hypothetical protein
MSVRSIQAGRILVQIALTALDVLCLGFLIAVAIILIFI